MRHIGRNVSLATAALLGLAGMAAPATHPAGHVIAAVTGATGAVLVVFLEDLVELFAAGPAQRDRVL